ncbi:AAA family ATPase [Armatimonas sp.]|uniref:AAA family ATPase n=1 Tax=Armatimonas sp. TaxID=1872638 RepID=UPI003753C39A
MTLSFPPVCLIVLCGASGSGKSTWARRHFRASQLVSSDSCREMVVDDAGSQSANDDAFALFHQWIALRLKNRRLTVADSTALKPGARDRLIALAHAARVPVHVVAFDVPLDEAIRRDAQRVGRSVGEKVVTRHRATLEQALREFPKDTRLAGVHILSPEQMDEATVQTTPGALTAPAFDVIGDVHGCLSELQTLLGQLGYSAEGTHPTGRVPVFVGDLADRGPDSPGVLRFVCDLVARDKALFVPGNHDDKLFRMLRGGKVQRTHGLDLTEEQLLGMPEKEREHLTLDILAYLAPQPVHLVLAGGTLAVAHAGIRDDMLGQSSDFITRFTRFGDVRGFEASGMPIRHAWAAERENGDAGALICYGHTPQDEIRFVNNTVNLDGGCVFGGFLAALRFPERELVTTPAERAYAEKRVHSEA